MEFPHTINLSAFDMSEQKEVEQICHKVILHEDHIEFELEITAEEPSTNEEGMPDKGLPWQRVRTYLLAVIKREKIIGADMCYINKDRLYKIVILVPTAEPRFYFKTRTKANEFFQTLNKYIFP